MRDEGFLTTEASGLDVDELGDRANDAGGFRTAGPRDGGRDLWRGGARSDGLAVPASVADQAARSLRGRGERAPGARRADGGPQREALGGRRPRGLRFDAPVPSRGYQWFYFDALSDDGESSVVVIALLGSPFSPAYARARASGAEVDPLDFSAINVALRHRRRTEWALTERSARSVRRTRGALDIGTSSVRWDGDALVIDLRERSSPWGAPIDGHIVFRPTVFGHAPLAIDGEGQHLWQPFAPLGRAEVRLRRPGLSFQGCGYLDGNRGDAPLEEGFESWSWARVSDDEDVRITYDVKTRSGLELEHGLELGARGSSSFEGREKRRLRPTSFGLPRHLRVGAGEVPRLVQTLENGPFYARSSVEIARGRRSGRPLLGVHETMSLDRLASRWVRFLIPFRVRCEP